MGGGEDGMEPTISNGEGGGRGGGGGGGKGRREGRRKGEERRGGEDGRRGGWDGAHHIQRLNERQFPLKQLLHAEGCEKLSGSLPQ